MKILVKKQDGSIESFDRKKLAESIRLNGGSEEVVDEVFKYYEKHKVRETTTNNIYKDLDTTFVIAISNNAWFTPSIQPTLQKLLMKYYAYKYNLYFYNVTNK